MLFVNAPEPLCTAFVCIVLHLLFPFLTYLIWLLSIHCIIVHVFVFFTHFLFLTLSYIGISIYCYCCSLCIFPFLVGANVTKPNFPSGSDTVFVILIVTFLLSVVFDAVRQSTRSNNVVNTVCY